MPRTIINRITRRGFIGTTLGLTAAAGALAATSARAQSLSKSEVSYQTGPRGDQRCDNCAFWLAGNDPKSIGACSMVQGEIEPSGWCAIWAEKD